MNTPFSAVLLAGGRSQRMGRDKALLPLADGRLLWQRQLDVLRELEPAEVFVSGPFREEFPTELRCLEDEQPARGPLSGIAAALGAMQTGWLLALAIDLPKMTAGFLRHFILLPSATLGMVGRHPGSEFFEPLAALYPRGCLPLAQARLQTTDHSVQSFVHDALAVGLIQAREIHPAEERFFTNWNTPGGDAAT